MSREASARGVTTRGKGSKSGITAVEADDEVCIDCSKIVVDGDKDLQCEVCDKWLMRACTMSRNGRR